jgi:hypothetical protein
MGKRILVGLRWHDEEAVVFLGFPMNLEKKETYSSQ